MTVKDLHKTSKEDAERGLLTGIYGACRTNRVVVNACEHVSSCWKFIKKD